MWTALRYLFPSACEGCGGPTDGRLCPGCLSLDPSEAAPVDGLGWVVAFAPYDSGLARALRGAKYGADRALMRVVARRFAEGAAPLAVGFDALVPIPSPWTRRLHRGFAPAAVLAQQVARASGTPVADVLRVAPGPRQAGMTGRARRGNLRGRLRAVSPVPGRVLLIDDVSTTGATLSAAARELLGDRTDRVCGVVVSARPGRSP